MIIAYASANADPINNPTTDAEIDLSSVALPTTVDLYGAATDTADPAAAFSWAWQVLDPAGVVLSSTTTQNITVSNITAWHNVRVHLVATNTSTAETSETDILLAPSASFCEVRLLSANRGIQKLAQGSRSWHPALEVWADAIENTAANLVLNDLSDVSTATGSALDVLVGGGNAEQGGSVLHTHDGDHIASASTTTAGVVQLEDASNAIGVPRVITQERIILTATAGRTVTSTGTIVEEIISPADNMPQSAFVVKRHDSYVRAISISLVDCGTTTTAYEFRLAVGTSAQYEARALPLVGDTITATPSAANQPLIASAVQSTPILASAGAVIGLVCTSSPASGAGGQLLTATIELERRVV